MSVRVMTWVMYESPSTGNDRLVLLVIADEADDDGGNAFPSIDLIAHKARVNRTTVLRAIARLEGGGELLVKRPATRGRGAFNRYLVAMGRDPVALAGKVGWPPPSLDEKARQEWLQSATLENEDNPGDDPGDVTNNGSERSHQAPETVDPGATVRVDPLTQPRFAESSPQRHRRGLDPPSDPKAGEQAAQRARAEAGMAHLAAERDRLAKEVPDDPDERRRVLEERRATRAS